MRALAVVLLTITACGHAALPSPTVSLRVSGAKEQAMNASVTIDDEHVGSLAEVEARGVALPPGTHYVTVEADGYFPWDKEVVAKQGDPPIHLDVKLIPKPD